MRLSLIHSDRGGQYTSHKYQAYLEANDLQGSMSRKNHCYENALMERFFGTLKDWCVVGEVLAEKIARWIETEYNAALPHSELSDLPPAEFEELFYARQVA